jgi:hypothetical protein
MYAYLSAEENLKARTGDKIASHTGEYVARRLARSFLLDVVIHANELSGLFYVGAKRHTNPQNIDVVTATWWRSNPSRRSCE